MGADEPEAHFLVRGTTDPEPTLACSCDETFTGPDCLRLFLDHQDGRT